jgi:hypothetical protein
MLGRKSVRKEFPIRESRRQLADPD